MEIVRARIDVIFDELARLPPLPVAAPVAATHNQQRKCTAAWLYELTSIPEKYQDANERPVGPTCGPSSWYRILWSTRSTLEASVMNRCYELFQHWSQMHFVRICNE